MIKRNVKKSSLIKVKKKSALVRVKKKSTLVRNVSKRRLERKVRIDYSKYVSVVDTDTNTNSFTSVKKVSRFRKFIKKVLQVLKFQINYTYRQRYNRRYRG